MDRNVWNAWLYTDDNDELQVVWARDQKTALAVAMDDSDRESFHVVLIRIPWGDQYALEGCIPGKEFFGRGYTVHCANCGMKTNELSGSEIKGKIYCRKCAEIERQTQKG